MCGPHEGLGTRHTPFLKRWMAWPCSRILGACTVNPPSPGFALSPSSKAAASLPTAAAAAFPLQPHSTLAASVTTQNQPAFLSRPQQATLAVSRPYPLGSLPGCYTPCPQKSAPESVKSCSSGLSFWLCWPSTLKIHLRGAPLALVITCHISFAVLGWRVSFLPYQAQHPSCQVLVL